MVPAKISKPRNCAIMVICDAKKNKNRSPNFNFKKKKAKNCQKIQVTKNKKNKQKKILYLYSAKFHELSTLYKHVEIMNTTS